MDLHGFRFAVFGFESPFQRMFTSASPVPSCWNAVHTSERLRPVRDPANPSQAYYTHLRKRRLPWSPGERWSYSECSFSKTWTSLNEISCGSYGLTSCHSHNSQTYYTAYYPLCSHVGSIHLTLLKCSFKFLGCKTQQLAQPSAQTWWTLGNPGEANRFKRWASVKRRVLLQAILRNAPNKIHQSLEPKMDALIFVSILFLGKKGDISSSRLSFQGGNNRSYWNTETSQAVSEVCMSLKLCPNHIDPNWTFWDRIVHLITTVTNQQIFHYSCISNETWNDDLLFTQGAPPSLPALYLADSLPRTPDQRNHFPVFCPNRICRPAPFFLLQSFARKQINKLRVWRVIECILGCNKCQFLHTLSYT